MTDKYDFVQRDDMVMTSVKFRTIRKYKNYKKGDRFWQKHGWKKLSWHNKIYPFTRWMIKIGDETIWAKCVLSTNTREVWRFERCKRYRWWFTSHHLGASLTTGWSRQNYRLDSVTLLKCHSLNTFNSKS